MLSHKFLKVRYSVFSIPTTLGIESSCLYDLQLPRSVAGGELQECCSTEAVYRDSTPDLYLIKIEVKLWESSSWQSQVFSFDSRPTTLLLS